MLRYIVVLSMCLSVGKPTDGDISRSDRFAPAIEHGRAVMQELVSAEEVPGVSVAVAVGGELVWSEGFGYADLENSVPATAKTRFGLGSVSKTLTMAGVLTLVDADLLDLDEPIETYLPDFPHKGQGITIRRIAVHQSGISDAYEREHYYTTTHFPNVDSAYQHVKEGMLEFPPGSQTAYATGTFAIIARAMEAVAGQSYLQIMQERVFGPAGMGSVVSNDPQVAVQNRTGFYIRAAGGDFERGPAYDPSHKLPGAGFLSTAEDAARFGAALLRSEVISPEARQEMFTPVPLASGEQTDFALGLNYWEEEGQLVLFKTGGGIGISALLSIYPEQDLVIALLCNVTRGPVGGRPHQEIGEAFLESLKEED
ncbi:MAG: beta-lactamase family protein [Fidelibacterota bacterium]|nr:MAG: beta-lactamase family protein [Candidatus Neomarinimicrobiota bacterium]